MALGQGGQYSGQRLGGGFAKIFNQPRGASYGNVPENYYGSVSSPLPYKWNRTKGFVSDMNKGSLAQQRQQREWESLPGSIQRQLRAGGGISETPLGNFQSENWQQRAMFDLAGAQRGETLSHADRLRAIAGDVASKGGAGFSESLGKEVPGLVTMLSDYLKGNVNVTDMPAFSGAADYIEQATRRTNAAGGYNMGGKVANEVAANLQKYSMDVYDKQVGHIVSALDSHGRNAQLFPSEIYGDLMAQGSQAEAGQYDPYGSVIGYISELSQGRV